MADQAQFQVTTAPAMTPCPSSNTTPDVTIAEQSNGIRLNAGRRIELLPIDQLVPQSRNPRTHSRKQIRQLAAGMRRYGFTAPVLVDEDDQILAGHGRVAAAKQIGLTTVPAIRLSHLSAAEKRGYVIADNRLAENARWDRDILAIEFKALVDLNFDVELTGFDPGEIDITLADVDEAPHKKAAPEQPIPELVPDHAVSRPGDLWLLGPHRLLCGDVLDPAGDGLLLDVDVTVKRWQSHTGRPAKLEATRQTFEDVAKDRLAADTQAASGGVGSGAASTTEEEAR